MRTNRQTLRHTLWRFAHARRRLDSLLFTALFALATLGAADTARAQINLPPGFAVDVLLNQIDGATPRLEAIRNPAFGSGVIAADLTNGVLTVKRISQSSVDVLATMGGFNAPVVNIPTVQFDTTGLFANGLYLSIRQEGGSDVNTTFFQIGSNGAVMQVAGPFGGPTNGLIFLFDFTDGSSGYIPGAYLEDLAGPQGTSLWHLDPSYTPTILAQNSLPPGRTDLDVVGIGFDTTGVYGSRLIMADSDPNNDNIAVILELLPDLTWVNLSTPVPTQQRFYGDMAISPGGAFGQALYVTDTVTDTVMSVDPNGVHTVFASGFSGISSITLDATGNNMFVSDGNAVYRIRAAGAVPGPQLVMREPKVEPGDVHTGPNGVDATRLLFSEAVTFVPADVSVVNSSGMTVPISVAGSGSQFMIIGFGQPLLDDVYTITVVDTAGSAATGVAIDGDNDGLAGGNLVLTLEHRRRSDITNNGVVNAADLATLLVNWGLVI